MRVLRGSAAPSLLLFALAAGAPPSVLDVTPLEVKVADTAVPSFASEADAAAFLSEALPAATAANPKYRTPGADYDRRWLIKTVEFSRGERGAIATIDEAFEDYRNGALVSRGTHQAAFSVNDVAITLETAEDVADTGAKAQGVLFTCVGEPCIQSVWDGQKSVSARTDVYVQDAQRRDQILAAFLALQGKADSR